MQRMKRTLVAVCLMLTVVLACVFAVACDDGEPKGETYSVTISYGAGYESSMGSATADKTSYAAGETVTITVTENSGYVVDKVTAGGTELTAGSNGVYTFTIGADTDVVVTFKASSVTAGFSVTIEYGTGYTAIMGAAAADKTSYEDGDTVSITVTPGAGYEVDTVQTKVDGQITGSLDKDVLGKYTFVIEADTVVVVTFKVASANDTPLEFEFEGTYTCADADPTDITVNADGSVYWGENRIYLHGDGGDWDGNNKEVVVEGMPTGYDYLIFNYELTSDEANCRGIQLYTSNTAYDYYFANPEYAVVEYQVNITYGDGYEDYMGYASTDSFYENIYEEGATPVISVHPGLGYEVELVMADGDTLTYSEVDMGYPCPEIHSDIDVVVSFKVKPTEALILDGISAETTFKFYTDDDSIESKGDIVATSTGTTWGGKTLAKTTDSTEDDIVVVLDGKEGYTLSVLRDGKELALSDAVMTYNFLKDGEKRAYNVSVQSFGVAAHIEVKSGEDVLEDDGFGNYVVEDGTAITVTLTLGEDETIDEYTFIVNQYAEDEEEITFEVVDAVAGTYKYETTVDGNLYISVTYTAALNKGFVGQWAKYVGTWTYVGDSGVTLTIAKDSMTFSDGTEVSYNEIYADEDFPEFGSRMIVTIGEAEYELGARIDGQLISLIKYEPDAEGGDIGVMSLAPADAYYFYDAENAASIEVASALDGSYTGGDKTVAVAEGGITFNSAAVTLLAEYSDVSDGFGYYQYLFADSNGVIYEFAVTVMGESFDVYLTNIIDSTATTLTKQA